MVLCRTIQFCSTTLCRSISTTKVVFAKKNVRKFPLFHFRWTREFKKRQEVNPDPDIPVYKFGVRDTGYKANGKFHEVPEMIPELIVPNLKDCELKPYVSYKAADVIQSEFTAQDLFDAVYSRKMEDDFKAGKLDEKGNPTEPSQAEKLTPKEAKRVARQTGSDIFE